MYLFYYVGFAHENYEHHIHRQWVFWNTNDNTILKNSTSTREIFNHMILIFPHIFISKLSISISFCKCMLMSLRGITLPHNPYYRRSISWFCCNLYHNAPSHVFLASRSHSAFEENNNMWMYLYTHTHTYTYMCIVFVNTVMDTP